MSAHANLERRRQAIYGWLLLTPALVLLSVFAFYPTMSTLWSSLFSRGTRRNPVEYIGTGNYTELFADPTFWIVVKNNLLYAGVTIPVSMAIALAMALWANGKISARGFVRTAYFTPTVLPMIAAANLWLFFYTPGLGGFFMIFYLAALQTIPEDLKEAADIEGTSRWTYTRRIVLPLLMPTTIFIAINALINSVKLIDHLFILTKGGPSDASKLLLYYIWEMAFAFYDAPQAAAMTILVIGVLAIVAAAKFLYLDKRTHYQ
jgi:sn-glycerol 3-phosphate transport system permease protein